MSPSQRPVCCRFRRIPPATTYEDEFAAEPWFSVGENDVFPEEFHAFLVPPGELRDAFLEAHGDLLDVAFWQRVQQRLGVGEVVDVFPYRRSETLRRTEQRGTAGPSVIPSFVPAFAILRRRPTFRARNASADAPHPESAARTRLPTRGLCAPAARTRDSPARRSPARW